MTKGPCFCFSLPGNEAAYDVTTSRGAPPLRRRPPRVRLLRRRTPSRSEPHAVEIREALLCGLEGIERRIAEARVMLDDVVANRPLGRGEDLREVDDALTDDLDAARERAGRHVLDVEQLDAVAVALEHLDGVREAAAVRRPVQVELEDDVARVRVLHEDVERRPVTEDPLELPVVVVDHQGLTRLARLRAELVQVLGVGDPLRLGGVVGRAAGSEVLDAQDPVLLEDLLEIDRSRRRADVHVPPRRVEPVLVEQRSVLLRREPAQGERLDVAVAHLAEPAQHLFQPRMGRCVGAEADVLRERPELDRDLARRHASAHAIGLRSAGLGCRPQAEARAGEDGQQKATRAAARTAGSLHVGLPSLRGFTARLRPYPTCSFAKTSVKRWLRILLAPAVSRFVAEELSPRGRRWRNRRMTDAQPSTPAYQASLPQTCGAFGDGLNSYNRTPSTIGSAACASSSSGISPRSGCVIRTR